MDLGLYVSNGHAGITDDAIFGKPYPYGFAISPATFITIAQLAEEYGVASLWFGDHVILPSSTVASHPGLGLPPGSAIRNGEPFFDATAVMAWLGTQTNHVRLGFSILVIPYRNPVTTAKFLASVDVLTEGRLILGSGVGSFVEEFRALNAPYEARGQVTDEYLAVMRELWTADEPSFDGDHYHLEPGLTFLPKPAHGTIPIWVGGNTKAAMRRAIRLGEGWLPVYNTHDVLRQKWEQLCGLALSEGRDPSSITFAHHIRLFVDEGARSEAPPGIGSPSKIADDIARFAELGVEHLVLATPPGPTTAAIRTQIERFGNEIRPLLPKEWFRATDRS